MGCYIKKTGGVGSQVFVAGQVANDMMIAEGYEWYDGEIPDRADGNFLKWDGEQVYEDIEARRDVVLTRVRRLRDAILAQSDWVVVRCTEAGVPVPSEWVTYRQSLRDFTNTYDVKFEEPEISWPVPPAALIL